MTTTDKLTRLKTDIDEVYNKGYEQGKAEVVDYMPYASNIIFSDATFEITDNIYLDLPNATNINNMFRYVVQLNCEKITVRVSKKCTDAQWAFASNALYGQDALKTIEILGDTSGVTRFENAFRNRANLESILGEIDFSGVTQSRFVGAMWINNGKMKEIYPKAGTIKVSINFYAFANPPDECINAIVNGLADLTGQESQTVTLHANVKAKLTEEQIATITGKNWTLA